mmetsp:Transcript_18385/g.28390  ORF Transcript_18385/g.28390 Transcript_18385/m.28390 type:complete len:97 (-) Transcript_18385:24-314(-)|eukprot:CAMPEP_0195263142 /NCGR_PEP_ID=MMETSP0706-20130129/10145_1 /TAXON_ID=33640 /ORGANISM="Asterionellopsis glacialis, Strain CCMP134" /LENGTH=96 /DNA_ID=CAMNT_0040317299 /DNA_START=19 /DNA_END=309 /DNA_ORIENTATION=+
MKTSNKANGESGTASAPYSLKASLSTLMLRSCHRHGSQPIRRTPEERRRRLQRTLQAAIQLVITSEDHHPPTGTFTSSEKQGKDTCGNIAIQSSPK